MDPATLARWERRLRPFVTRLPPALVVRLYAAGRRRFAAALARCRPPAVAVGEEHARVLWGIRFRAPLLNAAGMFKNGDGYEVAARQGAGGFLAGTTTAAPRRGNERHGVVQPFAPCPRSGAALNWLGLPNDGHARVAARLAAIGRRDGCPVGASVAA
ncbi:MAG: hypothetical protein D6696_01165, partial [Acidobacteria bacterium]